MIKSAYKRMCINWTYDFISLESVIGEQRQGRRKRESTSWSKSRKQSAHWEW